MKALARRKSRKKVFLILNLLFVLGILELISTVGLMIFDHRNVLKVVRFPSDRAMQQKIRSSKLFKFDPDLGWDERKIIRNGKGIIPWKKYFASAYGDSFTYDAELKNHQSWPVQFSDRHKEHRILNMGIRAGGPDQAYLKFVKYYKRYPTKVVLLGILPENINRLVSVVRKFYFRYDQFPMVKPRYILTAAGTIQLMRNPISNERQLVRLSNPEFMLRIAQFDFWYLYHRDRYGFDMVQGRSFPALRGVYRLISGQLTRDPRFTGHIQTFARSFYADERSEPLRIMKHIVRQFKKQSRALGFTPVVIIHCGKSDALDPKMMRPFVAFVRKEGVAVFNVIDQFIAATRRGTRFRSLFRKTHYSQTGSHVLSRGLGRFLTREGLMP